MSHNQIKLEQRLFEYICLIQSVVMGYFMIQSSIRHGWTLLTTIDLLIAGLGLLLYYLSHYRSLFAVLQIPMIISLYGSCIFYWYNLNGLYGSAAIGGIIVGIAIILISKSGQNLIFLIISMLFLMTLVVFQVYSSLGPEENIHESLALNYLIFAVAIFSIVYFVKNEYDKERVHAGRQTRKLEILNEQLKSSIRDKEAFILKLNQTRDQLVESEKMASVGRLTAGLAHELNNPLNFVGGNVKPLKEDLIELKSGLSTDLLEKNQHIFTEIEELLQNIQEGSRRASAIIDNLLKISPRSQSDQESLIDVSDMLRRTILLFKNVYTNVTFEIKQDQEVSLIGNTVELNQVILNLLKNAVDATKHREKGFIDVSVKKHEETCRIRIIDNGHGIDAALSRKIFDPFFTTKEEGEGTGLGLYISYGIIKKHGGELTCVPREVGACFQIILPLNRNLNQDE